MLQIFTRTIASLLLCSILTSCGSGSGNHASAQLRFVSALADLNEVDFLVDDTVIVSNYVFGEPSDYFDVNDGRRDIIVQDHNDGSELLTFSAGLDKEKKYTFVYTGIPGSPQGFLQDDSRNAPDPGKFKLRIFNSAPGLGPVDVYVDRGDPDLADTTPRERGLVYGDLSDYADDREDDYRIRVTRTGSDEVLIDSGLEFFRDGEIITVIVLDRLSSEGSYRIIFLKDLS